MTSKPDQLPYLDLMSPAWRGLSDRSRDALVELAKRRKLMRTTTDALAELVNQRRKLTRTTTEPAPRADGTWAGDIRAYTHSWRVMQAFASESSKKLRDIDRIVAKYLRARADNLEATSQFRSHFDEFRAITIDLANQLMTLFEGDLRRIMSSETWLDETKASPPAPSRSKMIRGYHRTEAPQFPRPKDGLPAAALWWRRYDVGGQYDCYVDTATGSIHFVNGRGLCTIWLRDTIKFVREEPFQRETHGRLIEDYDKFCRALDDKP